MRYPKWYREERSALARRVQEMELDPAEAAEQLSGHVLDKDDDFRKSIVAAWVAADLTRETRRLASVRVRQRRREFEHTVAVVGGAVEFQPTLDDDLFPGPDSTLLVQDGEYAYNLLGRSERHHERARRRVAFFERLKAAVGGNRDGKATRGQAKAALASGNSVAEG